MSTENVEVRVEVNNGGNTQSTVRNIKKELKEAQAEALRLSRQFGELSPQAQEAVNRIAALRDEIADLNERVDLADPGAKFKAFGNAIAAVTAGFSAAQGAMAIFGAESEDLQKTMVKLQAAMNLTQSLSTIADSWKDFQRLGTIIKTNVVSAFSTLKGAIISTGIGALIVAIGLVIANFEKVEAWIKKMFPAFEGFGKLFDKLKAVAMGAFNAIIESFKVVGEILADLFTGDFVGAAAAANTAGQRIGKAYADGFEKEVADQLAEAARKATEQLIKTQENQLKVLRAYGATREKDAEALELEIAKNKVKVIDASNKEGKEKQAEALADLEALSIQQYQKEGQRQLKALQDRQALQMQALSDSGKSTIGLRERQLLDQLKLERQYGLDTLSTEQELLQARQADRKSAFDKELQTMQATQDLLLQAATVSGKNIYSLRDQQLNAQLALYRKYGYSTVEIERQIAANTLAERQKLNEALSKNADEGRGKILYALENLALAQANLEQERAKRETVSAMRIEALEKFKQTAYQQTYDLLSSITQDREGLSDMEQAAAVSLAVITEITENNKRSALEKTSLALKAASGILGQQTAVGKGVAIASTTIDTIVSASGAFKGVVQTIPGPWGIALGAAAAAAALVAGFARVKQIQRVQIPGGGSGGSAPGISAPPAPPVPSVQPNASTQLLQQIQQQTAASAQRVYVLESDITDKQKRVASIEENAKF